MRTVLALLLPATALAYCPSGTNVRQPAGAVVVQRCSPPLLVQLTKREKLVRERLNPYSDVNKMDDAQVRKYAYAMQIECQRLIRELSRAEELRRNMQRVLADDAAPTAGAGSAASSTTLETAALVSAMKVEGLVRYGLAHATAQTSWEAVRANHPEFSERSDEELYEAFRASGKGISSVYGELF